jgi:phage portal protein BeeE
MLTLDSLPAFLLNTESQTGISVTWSTALQVTTMFACARVVAEGIARVADEAFAATAGR